MTWKNIIKEEEDLPEDVKRARERIRQGLPSREQPLIPQFDDEKRMKKSTMTDETKEAIEKITQQLTDAFEGIDYDLAISIISPTGKKPAMTKKQLVEMLTKEAIKRLKADRLYR